MRSQREIVRFEEAKSTWRKIAQYAKDGPLAFELEVHKKLLNFFQVGDFYYYIFNLYTTNIELTSDSVTGVLGIAAAQDFTLDYILSIIHPDDLPVFVKFEKIVGEFLASSSPEKKINYKVSYDYRVRRTDGTYIRLLQQVVIIQMDENGGVLRTMGMHTDITRLKKDTTMSLSFIGMNGEPSFYDVSTAMPVPSNPVQFTKREIEILDILMQGKTSKQVADTLHISKLTVDTHRSNMLRKAEVKSIAELTVKYLQGLLG